jgi:hypothetical protein
MVTSEQLIALINAGTAAGATEQQRQLAAQACQTLAVALGAGAGQPLLIPGIPPPTPRPGPGQVIDVIAAQLRTFLDRQQTPAPAATTATAPPVSPSATSPESVHAAGPATPSR